MPRVKRAPKHEPVPPPPSSTVDLRERFKDYAGIEAFERSWEHPDGLGSAPILLKGEDPHACVDTGHQMRLKIGAVTCPYCGQPARQWYVRHVNTKQPGRVSNIRAIGYLPVTVKELLRPEEIADLQDSADGLVRTGHTGSRLLYKIPLDLYNARKRHQRDLRDAKRRSTKAMREELAEDAADPKHGLGAEAADRIHHGIEFTEKTYRSTIEDELSGVED